VPFASVVSVGCLRPQKLNSRLVLGYLTVLSHILVNGRTYQGQAVVLSSPLA
jgi:hypothetical protein